MTPENRANNILSGFSWTSREGCSPLEWIAGHIREAEARARAEGIEAAAKIAEAEEAKSAYADLALLTLQAGNIKNAIRRLAGTESKV